MDVVTLVGASQRISPSFDGELRRLTCYFDLASGDVPAAGHSAFLKARSLIRAYQVRSSATPDLGNGSERGG